MSTKRFNSKLDLWILLVLIFIVVVDLVIIVGIALEPRSPLQATVTILACVAAIALILSIMLRTHYTVTKGDLRIVSGPFRWKVPIAEITSVTPTRSAFSSPAMSLDRLSIVYGKGRRIMISPVDKAEFLKAIGQDHV